jgi:hypothetical protein
MGIVRLAQIAMLGFRNDLAPVSELAPAKRARSARKASVEQDCFFRPILEDHASALKLAQSV